LVQRGLLRSCPRRLNDYLRFSVTTDGIFGEDCDTAAAHATRGLLLCGRLDTTTFASAELRGDGIDPCVQAVVVIP
jgi:hypothetical protein